MQFFTVVDVQQFPFSLSHQDKIVAFGSCFTEHIATNLENYKFPLLANPYGISFNPISIHQSIQEILDQKEYKVDQLAFHNGLYHSWNHHSAFSHPDPEQVLDHINNKIKTARPFLAQSKVLFITWGSAYVYELRSTGEVVNNCHKYPDILFSRKLLSTTEITTAYQQLFAHLWALNPDLHIVLTVSPVRHWRDGLIENNRSKSTLILAAHELTSAFNSVTYFPAYELVIDELRDYRFYADDLVHPSSQAIKYVWDKFVHASMDEETQRLTKRIEKINRARHHRPLHADSLAHKQFRKQIYQEVLELAERYPQLNWTEELAYFNPTSSE